MVGGLGKCEMPARRDTMEEFDDGRLNPCTRVNIYLQNIQCKTSASQLSGWCGALIFSSSLAKDN